MSNHVLRFKNSITGAVTAVAADLFTNNTTDQIEVRLISNRATHISLVGDADATSAYVPADCAELLQVDPGKSISAIRTAAETDGDFWVTEIQRV